jgi:hypothetical protein
MADQKPFWKAVRNRGGFHGPSAGMEGRGSGRTPQLEEGETAMSNSAERRAGAKPEDDWAWKRIEGYLRDYLDEGGPDYEIVCRGIAMQIGVSTQKIKEMWAETREYKRQREGHAA